jgi:hypothetical protein
VGAESGLVTNADCVIDFEIPSGMTFKVFSEESEERFPIASILILIDPILVGRMMSLNFLGSLGIELKVCQNLLVESKIEVRQ